MIKIIQVIEHKQKLQQMNDKKEHTKTISLIML